ncbi:hypothetical protein PR048_032952 [Dryococelus australis]|uniref:Uncharacterized protein n=1 Tax=Dryococelus australis TaxID=614101 RepID=A0ABQ9G3Q8_9NEOP|nr:hypothetical protein PR048_032952 [Dryococelus australis]
MGIIGMPLYSLYWFNESRNPPIAYIMSHNRYIHFANDTFDPKDPHSDRLFDVCPIL